MLPYMLLFALPFHLWSSHSDYLFWHGVNGSQIWHRPSYMVRDTSPPLLINLHHLSCPSMCNHSWSLHTNWCFVLQSYTHISKVLLHLSDSFSALYQKISTRFEEKEYLDWQYSNEEIDGTECYRGHSLPMKSPTSLILWQHSWNYNNTNGDIRGWLNQNSLIFWHKCCLAHELQWLLTNGCTSFNGIETLGCKWSDILKLVVSFVMYDARYLTNNRW